MILPFSAEISGTKQPYVTYAIIILCLVIHHFQTENRTAIDSAAMSYCESIHNPYAGEDSLDYLSMDQDICREYLIYFHSLSDKSDIRDYFSEDEFPAEKFEGSIKIIRQHIDAFGKKAPPSLDNMLSYDPSSFNPLTSLTSGLAHADWWHVIGNLIFFFAFSTAVELLVGSTLKYIGILILIKFSCSIAYSFVSLGSDPIPTLGLSGVVMGIIGLSAYMMPWVRIRTFVWLLVFHIRVYYIPAWMLALWFFGWDAYYLFGQSDNGSINFVAHVSGTVAGYLIGVIWLGERREEVREELDEEIEYKRSQRVDRIGMVRSFKGGKARIINEQHEIQAGEQFNSSMDELYKLVNRRMHSEAIALFLDNYELYSGSIEIYEELFWEINKWRQGRSLLCLGRLNISLLLEHRQYNRALAIAKVCVDVKNEFVLANPSELLVLSEHAQSQQQYHLAYQLVHGAEARYGTTINSAQCQLLEADLLEHHLNEPEAAQKVMASLLDGTTSPALIHR